VEITSLGPMQNEITKRKHGCGAWLMAIKNFNSGGILG